MVMLLIPRLLPNLVLIKKAKMGKTIVAFLRLLRSVKGGAKVDHWGGAKGYQ
jgi:hypothetical protein